MSGLVKVDPKTGIAEKKEWFEIQNFQDAMQKSQFYAGTSLVPKAYVGKPQEILVAWAFGAEVGLKPMQALKHIAVINGTPSLWGDALPAFLHKCPDYEWHTQRWDEKEQKAYYTVKRKGHAEHTETFGYEDAKTKGYLNKDTYKTDLKGMCQKRARSAAIRNKFAEILLGLSIAEEEEDYEYVVTHKIQNVLTNDKNKERMASLGIQKGELITADSVTPKIEIENEDLKQHEAEPDSDLNGVDYIVDRVEQYSLHTELADILDELHIENLDELTTDEQRTVFRKLGQFIQTK